MSSIVEVPGLREVGASTPFGYPRDFLGNRFVYVAISPRARGLSVGVNLNPDKQCNFDCAYCEVDRRVPGNGGPLDLTVLAAELESTLSLVRSGALREQPGYSRVPPELLGLRHVAISGDGEPTLCPQFREAVETTVHVRAMSRMGFFKIVLITNASNLDAPQVQDGLRLLIRDDEIWAKLDVGTQAQMDQVNRSEASLEKILRNILLVAKQRPVAIQSLFPALNGCGPSEEEIEHYAQLLKDLKAAGGQISLVQIYSAARPTTNPNCGHLPLRSLSRIAQTVRSRTGLNAEIF
jgi:wyosine [tRNA(Phe)-imidazoG37] synthetase (radical SAM superfamily)